MEGEDAMRGINLLDPLFEHRTQFMHFDVEIYRKLEKYIDECRRGILPKAFIAGDEFPTIIPYGDASTQDLRQANLNICNINLIGAAKDYLAKFRVEYANYKKRDRTNDDIGKLDTKKQKGSSIKRVSRKKRHASKLQKRGSIKQL